MRTARLAVLVILGAMFIVPPIVSGQARPFVAGSKGAGAKKGGGKALTQLEMLQRMTPAERQKFLETLPEDRRQRLQQRLDQYEKQGDRLSRILDNWEKLPLAQQERVRRLFMRFNQMPPDRRMLLRAEMRSLSEMNDEQRRTRVASDEFLGKYSPDEQRFLFELSQALRTP